MTAENWLTEIHRELDKGESARAMGNEGMARVCARRAASIALGEYFHRSGLTGYGSSIHERINLFKLLSFSSDQAVDIANHLLLRVDEDHKLPFEIDLIEETRWLIAYIQRQMGSN